MKKMSYNKTKAIRFISSVILFIALIPRAFDITIINELFTNLLFIIFAVPSILLSAWSLWIKLGKRKVLEDESSKENELMADSMSNLCTIFILISISLSLDFFDENVKFNGNFIWMIALVLMSISDGYYLYLERSDDLDARDED